MGHSVLLRLRFGAKAEPLSRYPGRCSLAEKLVNPDMETIPPALYRLLIGINIPAWVIDELAKYFKVEVFGGVNNKRTILAERYIFHFLRRF